jgi:deoxyribodipyrimidine photolyase-related protein
VPFCFCGLFALATFICDRRCPARFGPQWTVCSLLATPKHPFRVDFLSELLRLGGHAQWLSESITSEEQARLIGSIPARRHWYFVPYDQLADDAPWNKHDPSHVGLLLVESTWKPKQRPYHKQKLVMLLANMREYALEQQQQGRFVLHLASALPYSEVLARVVPLLGVGKVRCQEPAERELRSELAASPHVAIIPNNHWLTSRAQFVQSQKFDPKGTKPWTFRMDAFYRFVRQETGILMDRGKPIGGKYSMDAVNRLRWDGTPKAPPAPRFDDTALKVEVRTLVEARFASHPGSVSSEQLPTTRADIDRLWSAFLQHGLPYFGPYEDAMAKGESTLFHARISALLNLGRLDPKRVLKDVLVADVPFASKEGFVRQVLGWREFVKHVHDTTEGFTVIGPGRNQKPALDAAVPLPPTFYRGAWPSYDKRYGALKASPSGFACLDDVVESVWHEAYSHHIPRLMVLSNIATLLGVSPRELTNWFWVAYADAFDWVVEPNVLGMGTYSVGDLMTTKPYVSGAAYIDKMSNYCKGCSFDPKKNCPITRMYWDFLNRNEPSLRGNQRIALPLASARKRSAEVQAEDARITNAVRRTLAEGKTVTPKTFTQSNDAKKGPGANA